MRVISPLKTKYPLRAKRGMKTTQEVRATFSLKTKAGVRKGENQ